MSRIGKEEEEYTQRRQTRKNSENLDVCVYIHTFKHTFFFKNRKWVNPSIHFDNHKKQTETKTDHR